MIERPDNGVVMLFRVTLASGEQYDVAFTGGVGEIVSGYEILLLEGNDELPIVKASFAQHGTGYHTICSLWSDNITKVETS